VRETWFWRCLILRDASAGFIEVGKVRGLIARIWIGTSFNDEFISMRNEGAIRACSERYFALIRAGLRRSAPR
jgi:hypothetical protein